MTRTSEVEPGTSCVDVGEALSRGEVLSADARKHVAECPVCSVSIEKTLSAESPEALLAAVEAAMQREKGFSAWLRSLPTPVRMASGALWAVLLVTVVGLATPRGAFGPVPVRCVALVVAGLATLFGVALRIGLRPLQARPPERGVVLASFFVGLFAPVVFAVLPRAGRDVTSLPMFSNAQATIGCFVIGLVPGALLVAGLRMLDRGAHRAREVALLAAVAGGLTANAALELHCPITAPGHLLLGHATVGFALLAAYALTQRRRLA